MTTAPIHYRIDCRSHASAHLYQVTMRIAAPAAQQILRMPVWIPGSYLVRNFARQVQQLSATQGKKRIAVTQLDKSTWQLDCVAGKAVEIRYEVYAFDDSVRTAYLDTRRAFFNPTSLCFAAEGKQNETHTLSLDNTTRTQVATGAASLPNKRGQTATNYRFDNYDHLADTPFEICTKEQPFWSGSFTLHGIKHTFVITGAPDDMDGKRLLRDTKKICAEHIAFWHGKKAKDASTVLDMKHYVFMLNATESGYGGLEHRNSTALICRRTDLPLLGDNAKPSKDYTTLLGLISHEYFHTWNVKRLRPAEFASYDYQQEQYTELLWFFEGFTSYYDDLALLRADIIDQSHYLSLLVRALNYTAHTPGGQVQTVAQSSFDAWVKYYIRDANTNNQTISYYVKGAMVALCYDLTLRTHGYTLDAVMQRLWKRCKGAAMTEADFLAVLDKVAGKHAPALRTLHQAWVHNTQPLPMLELLEEHGVTATLQAPTTLQWLGCTTNAQTTTLQSVAHGGLAQQAGLAPQDELLAINGWRIRKTSDLDAYFKAYIPQPTESAQKTKSNNTKATILYCRDGKLHETTLTLKAPKKAQASSAANASIAPYYVRALRVTDNDRAAQWLDK